MATSALEHEPNNNPAPGLDESTSSSGAFAQNQGSNSATPAMSNTLDPQPSEPNASSEAFARDPASNSTTTATSKQVLRRNLLLDLPAEIVNQIYANCKILQVDIAYKIQPRGFEGLLTDFHPKITEEFPDIYYTENMFLLGVRREFKFHGRNRLDGIWKPWISRLNERHAGVIQHFRILTPAFSAVTHIPINRNEDVTVRFQGHNRKSEAGVQVDKLIVEFNKKLQCFNARLEGQRLGKDDLDLLIKAIISTVPYCCRDAGESDNFCFSRPESGELPEECLCRACHHRLLERDN
jgi:hypothetical protein